VKEGRRVSDEIGAGVRIAVIDSGVHAGHPHVGGVAGGIGIRADGSTEADYIDRLGHGTAVTAAIREKAPAAELFAVRIFEQRLSGNIDVLLRAIDWAADSGMQLVNLSLGTTNAAHESALRERVCRAVERGALIVAARDDDGVSWLPGSLPGVIPVQLDWDCPRDEYRTLRIDGVEVYRASGYPREIPGVPRERNLSGISFAVANVTGLLARLGSARLESLLTARRRECVARPEADQRGCDD
jgi:subtilisin family serine protease